MELDRIAHDAARHELTRRVTALSARTTLARGPSTAELAAEIDRIRAIALASGMLPAASVAHALSSALARGERGPLVRGWLAILGDAACADRNDADACASFAGACSVRLAR